MIAGSGRLPRAVGFDADLTPDLRVDVTWPLRRTVTDFGLREVARETIFFDGDFFRVFARVRVEPRTAFVRLDEALLTETFDVLDTDRPEAFEVETVFFGLDCALVRFESLSLIGCSFKEAPASAGLQVSRI